MRSRRGSKEARPDQPLRCKTSAESFERISAFLHEGRTRPLDITTVEQARKALGLPPDDELRWRLYEHLQANPGSLASKTRYGVSASMVTLTNEEKLAGPNVAQLLGRARIGSAGPTGRRPQARGGGL